MSRPDQSITFLSTLGYSVVSLPRSDLKPGQTLLRRGKKDLTRLGDLATIMTAGANPLPAVSTDNFAPTGVSGQQSSSVDLNVGVTILGNILQALTGKNLNLSAGFKNTKSVTFAYEDVLEDHVALDQLDLFLTSATLKAGNSVREAFEKNNIFVLLSTIKSRKITVTAQGDNDLPASLEVPVINGVASGDLKVDLAGAAKAQVSFEGATPVIFGFQAVEIFTENGRFSTVDPSQPGKMALRDIHRQISPTFLDLGGAGVFFRMTDAAQSADTKKAGV